MLMLLRGLGPRSLAHSLFGLAMLGALWVTALTSLSARPTATALLTDVGTNILNPHLVSAGVGLAESNYATLQKAAAAHPDQSLPVTFLTINVPGRAIVGHPYAEGVRIVYGKVAEAYYDGGPSAVFNLPPQLTQLLNTFGMFSPDKLLQQPIAGANLPQLPQLPSWLKPFFTFIGLTPTTFTAQGHDSMQSLMLPFWLAALVTGVLAFLLSARSRRFSTVSRTLLHGAWPVLALFGAVWLYASANAVAFKPYADIYSLAAKAFVPVYGIAAAVGLVGWVVPGLFSRLGFAPGRAQRVPVGAPVGAYASERHPYDALPVDTGRYEPHPSATWGESGAGNPPGFRPVSGPGAQSGYGQGTQQGYGPGVQPGYRNSAEPGYGQDAQPSYGQGAPQGYRRSMPPGYGQNARPGNGGTGQPGYDDTTQPGYGMPDAPPPPPTWPQR